MSLTVLLALALPDLAFAEDGCDDSSHPVEAEGAYYLEGVGCVVGDISLYCEEAVNGDCKSWDQVVARYEDSPPEVKDIYLLDCAQGSDYAHRWNQSSSAWEAYQYFDEDGFSAGRYNVTFGDPYCCKGVETYTRYYGDPYATCIEPTDTGDSNTADTPKTGPCGCATDTGAAAAALFAASSLLTLRRRRQP
ncbi:hypothetical protein L6R49_24200 [Myxococcota bacterium]|nr:hypothetical protein [Myxococcota bacterium]